MLMIAGRKPAVTKKKWPAGGLLKKALIVTYQAFHGYTVLKSVTNKIFLPIQCAWPWPGGKT